MARRVGAAFRRWFGVGAVVAAVALLPGCFTFQHTVGRGPQSTPPQVVTETRWFAFYGLMPLSDVDSAQLAGAAHDYRVTTEFTPADVFLSAITSLATFYRQTITIEK